MGRSRLDVLALVLVTASVNAACDDKVDLGRVKGVLTSDGAIDFGDVQVGMTMRRDLELKNAGDAPIDVWRLEPAETGFAGSTHEFKLLNEPFVLPARGTVQLGVSYQPFRETEEPVETSVRLHTDLDDPNNPGQKLVYTVRLTGRGIASGLVIEPSPVDFGTVLVGSSRELEVTLTNRLSVPVNVATRRGANGQPELDRVAGDGQFEILSQLTPESTLPPGPIEPGASITVRARYSPDPAATGREDRARWTVSNCGFSLCDVQVTLLGRGTTGALECVPEAVDFGAVNPGRTRQMEVTCTNVASDRIIVGGWGLEPGSASEFSPEQYRNMPTDVEPGEEFTIRVTFAPTQATYQSGMSPVGNLMVDALHSNGRRLDPVRVPLTGRAGGPAIRVSPPRLYFGQIALGTNHTRLLLVENTGYDELVVSAVDGDASRSGAFFTPAGPFRLAVGSSTVVAVTFEPQVAGPVTSDVIFSSNDSADPELAVPLEGSGLDLPPCAYSVTPRTVSFGVVPFTQVAVRGVRITNLGNDACLVNDVEIVGPSLTSTSAFRLVNGPETNVLIPTGGFHDIPVEYAPTGPGGDRSDLAFYISDPSNPNPRVPLTGSGEPLTQVACPPAVTTPAGQPVTLTAMGSAFGGSIVGYDWAIIAAPNGGIGTPNQWNPNPPRAQTETFLPYIVGIYTIRVTAIDDRGGTATCTTEVTAEGQGLRVTMTWDGQGDVDLHVHNNLTQPWFQSPQDCYYGNRNPIWDPTSPAGFGGNPELDFDNTSAFGPENTSINVVAIGQPYTIAAHNYSRSAGRLVTMEIFCGGVTTPTASFVSQPLSGTASGNCSGNDFWKVATVVFTSQSTCTVTPINTYGPSSTYCAQF